MAIFAVAGTALFLSAIDATIVATALSTLHKSLDARLTWTGWIITVYQLGQAIAMPLVGRLSDQLGRRRLFIGAIFLFTLTSLLCGIATSVYELIVFRALQGISGGAFLPSATGIVSDHFGANRDRALGLFTSIFPFGNAVGPIFGGLMIQFWTWRGIFFINIPVGVVLAIAAIAVIPPSTKRPAARTDVVAVLQFTLAALGLMFGMAILGDKGVSVSSPTVALPLAVSVLAAVLFLNRARKHPEPLFPLRLLRGGGFSAMNVINIVFGACALGGATLIPLFAQDRYHISPLRSGTLLTARAIGMIAVAALATFLMRRTGCRIPIAIGFTVIAAGFVLMAVSPWAFGPYWWLAFGAAVTGVGFGISNPAANNAGLARAPSDVGVVAGLRGMFRQAGGIICISVITAFVARGSTVGHTLSVAFVLLGIITFSVLPLIRAVPEQRGSW